MSLLSELTGIVTELGLPVETGIFKSKAPDEYIVITPMTEEYALFCDDNPEMDIHEARISVYTKSNYKTIKNQLLTAFREADLTITQRRFVNFEPDTGYYHYTIDVEKTYNLTEV